MVQPTPKTGRKMRVRWRYPTHLGKTPDEAMGLQEVCRYMDILDPEAYWYKCDGALSQACKEGRCDHETILAENGRVSRYEMTPAQVLAWAMACDKAYRKNRAISAGKEPPPEPTPVEERLRRVEQFTTFVAWHLAAALEDLGSEVRARAIKQARADFLTENPRLFDDLQEGETRD